MLLPSGRLARVEPTTGAERTLREGRTPWGEASWGPWDGEWAASLKRSRGRSKRCFFHGRCAGGGSRYAAPRGAGPLSNGRIPPSTGDSRIGRMHPDGTVRSAGQRVSQRIGSSPGAKNASRFGTAARSFQIHVFSRSWPGGPTHRRRWHGFHGPPARPTPARGDLVGTLHRGAEHRDYRWRLARSVACRCVPSRTVPDGAYANQDRCTRACQLRRRRS